MTAQQVLEVNRHLQWCRHCWWDQVHCADDSRRHTSTIVRSTLRTRLHEKTRFCQAEYSTTLTSAKKQYRQSTECWLNRDQRTRFISFIHKQNDTQYVDITFGRDGRLAAANWPLHNHQSHWQIDAQFCQQNNVSIISHQTVSLLSKRRSKLFMWRVAAQYKLLFWATWRLFPFLVHVQRTCGCCTPNCHWETHNSQHFRHNQQNFDSTETCSAIGSEGASLKQMPPICTYTRIVAPDIEYRCIQNNLPVLLHGMLLCTAAQLPQMDRCGDTINETFRCPTKNRYF